MKSSCINQQTAKGKEKRRFGERTGDIFFPPAPSTIARERGTRCHPEPTPDADMSRSRSHLQQATSVAAPHGVATTPSPAPPFQPLARTSKESHFSP